MGLPHSPSPVPQLPASPEIPAALEPGPGDGGDLGAGEAGSKVSPVP